MAGEANTQAPPFLAALARCVNILLEESAAEEAQASAGQDLLVAVLDAVALILEHAPRNRSSKPYCVRQLLVELLLRFPVEEDAPETEGNKELISGLIHRVRECGPLLLQGEERASDVLNQDCKVASTGIRRAQRELSREDNDVVARAFAALKTRTSRRDNPSKTDGPVDDSQDGPVDP
jgi:hypothetical protein